MTTSSFSIDIPKQGSEEWHMERVGRFTSSRFHDLLTASKKKDEVFGGTAMGYILEIACERLTGQPEGFAGGRATDWGNDHESMAIGYYSSKKELKVEESPFIPVGTNYGGSPDGLIGTDGIIEVKCPFNSVNHLKYFKDGEIPKNYYTQMQGNMMVTGRKWCDFISFDPRMPESHRIFIKRIERDEELINRILERIELAEVEVQKIISNDK